MSLISWPPASQDDFPQKLHVSGFGQQQEENTIRTNIEAGIDKLRRRYTAPIVKFQGVMWLTHTNYLALELFYNTTLAGGVNRFDFPDPADDTSIYECRFMKPPTYSALGGLHYSVSLEFERLGLSPDA